MRLVDILQQHAQRYPLMHLQDYEKLVYQHTFGCGHAVENTTKSLLQMQEEYNSVTHDNPSFFESIGNGFVRFYLNAQTELPLALLHRMFLYSTRKTGSLQEYHENRRILRDFLKDRFIVHADVSEIPAPFSHSEGYTAAYHPHYRVMDDLFERYFFLIEEIYRRMQNEKELILIIDGPCTSGKTTLANALAFLYDAEIIHMDDFFLSPIQRSHTSLHEPGSNLDHERFQKEVADQIKQKQDFCYRPYDCHENDWKPFVHIKRGGLIIIEGVYSMHPRYTYENSLTVFLDIDPRLQQKRLYTRFPALMDRFLKEWIPLEEQYFHVLSIRKKAMVLIHQNIDQEEPHAEKNYVEEYL